MNLANSTMKKTKNSVPIVDFCESSWTFVKILLLFCFNCCKVDNACVKLGLCSTGKVFEPVLFEVCHQLFFVMIIFLRVKSGYDLHLQEDPIVDKHLRLDHLQSFDYGMFHLVCAWKASRRTRILIRVDQRSETTSHYKTVLEFPVTRRTSFLLWFQDYQRVLPQARLLQHP